MNYGFDIDGTISAAPIPYRAIMWSLVAAGHEVHVITGQTCPITEDDYRSRAYQLISLGIGLDCYTRLHIAGPPDWVADKRNYCAANDIVFMFENDASYAQAIGQVCPVTLMWVQR